MGDGYLLGSSRLEKIELAACRKIKRAPMLGMSPASRQPLHELRLLRNICGNVLYHEENQLPKVVCILCNYMAYAEGRDGYPPLVQCSFSQGV